MTTISDCCVTGFNWSGTPVGNETEINGQNVYQVGTSKDAAVLLIHDLLGWKFPNARLLADHYANEANVTVYMPDFFGGQSLPFEDILDDERRAKLDLKSFVARNGKQQRRDEIFAMAKHLRSSYKHVGSVGFCYGGWAVFQLGAKDNVDTTTGQPLVDCISTAHPSWLTKEEIDAVGVPVQILAPEHDPTFTQEVKDYSNRVIPTRGVPYEYRYFPGVEHAFATRGDPKKSNERQAMRQAKNAVVAWFKEFLSEQSNE